MSRIIDADAFVQYLKDAVKTQKYENLKIDEYLTVADVLNAVISELDGTSLVGFKNAPTIKPERWIPVTERPPEVGTYVLISKKALNFKSTLPSVCTAHRSCDPRSGKEEWNDMLFGKLDDDDVLAWMPCPEPYRKEGEQE